LKYTRVGVLAIAVVLLGLAGALPAQYTTFLIILSYFLILGMGWNLVGGFTYLAFFAEAGFLNLGGYISAEVVGNFNTIVPVGMAVSVVSVMAIAYGLGYITLRLQGAYLALSTIAFAQAIEVWISVNPGITGGEAGYFPAALIPNGTSTEYYYVFMGVTFACFMITYFVVKSPTGTMMKAVGNDEDAAKSLGVDVRRTRLIAFVIAGGFGAIAGALFAHYFQVITPEDGSLLNMAYIMAGPIIGGLGTLAGPLVGGLVVVGLRDYIEMYVGPYDVLIFALVMMLTIKFAPNGIVGIATSRPIRKLTNRIRGRSSELHAPEGAPPGHEGSSSQPTTGQEGS
jgi:branched-chain amino acid transport system permease protein